MKVFKAIVGHIMVLSTLCTVCFMFSVTAMGYRFTAPIWLASFGVSGFGLWMLLSDSIGQTGDTAQNEDGKNQ